MKIKTNSGNFQPCPEYTGSAVCVDVTPLKTVQTQFGPKEKFRFVFEIGEMKEDGTPWCVWSAPFTPSYHENSALRPFLRKWMGRELSADEVKDFDTENLLGLGRWKPDGYGIRVENVLNDRHQRRFRAAGVPV
jgi:hypothetical protein